MVVNSSCGWCPRWAVAIGVAVWLSAASAQAQTPGSDSSSDGASETAAADVPREEPSADRPWAMGVSPERQSRALARFAAGNALLDEALFKVALEKYREATELWNHPSIRYNMAVCQINLDQPIEAYRSIEAALAYGPDPLDAEIYALALTYKRLLEGQLAALLVQCDEPEATITLDGRPLLVCPGEHRELLEAGEYQVLAAKPGFLPRTYRLHLVGGQQRRIAVELLSIEKSKEATRRWHSWKPWAVIGAGAALALAALPLEIWSSSNYESYDRALDELCAAVACLEAELPEDVRDDRDRAQLQNRVAVGLFATGGVVVATGVIMVIFNRTRTSYLGYPEPGKAERALAPWVEANVVGLRAAVSF